MALIPRTMAILCFLPLVALAADEPVNKDMVNQAQAQPEPATQTPETASMKPRDNRRALEHVAASELQQIQVDGEEQAVLVRPWSGPKQLGAALLLPPPGTHADAPGLNAFLRRGINPAGWASISITPPPFPEQPNFTTEAQEISKAGDGKMPGKRNQATSRREAEEWQKLRKQQQSFIQQSLAQLDTLGAPFPGKRLLIAQDQCAALVIELLAAQELAKPDLLVVINPYLDDPYANLALPKQLAELDLAVLDIQSPDGHQASQATVKSRKSLAMSQPENQYRQRLLALDLRQDVAFENTLMMIDGMARKVLKQAPPNEKTATEAHQ
ncbi:MULTISPECIES: DUF3530 family protein [Shewanella]|uniref:DUF3530 family protein n=1 Tax=Shewanella TaxID=22 RepID=UPI00068B36DF|nr:MULTISPECIES: DUF3530 family protein [unclassified Shewanella]TVP13102.1 hypothetical protein AYI96_04615 [Shewanella sp. MSW]